MIEFINMCEIAGCSIKGQLDMFSTFVVEPGDVGLIIGEDKFAISFLIGDYVLSVEKYKEGVKYVRALT
jgi:hypothetical protein